MVDIMEKKYKEETWKEVVEILHKRVWKDQESLRKVILESTKKNVGRVTTTRTGT